MLLTNPPIQQTQSVLQSRTAAAVLSMMALIAVDQISKNVAFAYLPVASVAMASEHRMLGLAWHIHPPGAMTTLSSLVAVLCIGVMFALPLPRSAKILWCAAALSNNVEMLLRPGTMDFLAFRLAGHVWVANIADLYFVAGLLVIGHWTYRLIRVSRSWFEPITV